MNLLRCQATAPTASAADSLLSEPELPYHVTPVVASDGAALHVREYGPQGADRIVLVHGLAVRLEFWYPQINTLAQRYRIVVFDQRGCGLSAFPSRQSAARTFGLDTLGDDLASVLAATVPIGATAVVVGHSLGGLVVQSWARRHPQDVALRARAILLADTVSEDFAAVTRLLPAGIRSGDLRRRILHVVATNPAPWPPLWVVDAAYAYFALTPRASMAQRQFIHGLLASCATDVRAKSARVVLGANFSDGLACISVPTTVLVGADDRLTPPAAARHIADLLAVRGHLDRLVVLPDIGHCPSIETPFAVNAELERLMLRRPSIHVTG